MQLKKPKITRAEIESIASDGRIILGIKDLIIVNKDYAAALAEIPVNIDIQSACNAMNSAAKRVKYAYNINLIMRPCPIEIGNDASTYYREAAELIIRDINRDFSLCDFGAEEINGRIYFSFNLLVPKDFQKNNAELLNELKMQFKKLSKNIVLTVTIIRFRQNKSD